MLAADLLSPRGRLIAAALWPKRGKLYPLGYDEEEVAAKLAQWILTGTALANAAALTGSLKDDAVRAYSYWRAFDERLQVMVSMPSSVSTSQGASATFTDQQRADMRADRDTAWAEFIALVPQEVAASASPTLHSASTPAEFRW